MCFSAPASFVTSGALLMAGGIAMYKASNRPQRVFAAIPIMFAVQQMLEGFLWVALCGGSSPAWQPAVMYGYLIFAWLVWPVHIPVSMMLLEPDPRRKWVLKANVLCGIIVSVSLAVIMAVNEVSASIGEYHIAYYQGTNELVVYSIGLLYMLATIIAPFITSLRRIRWIGVVNLVSVMISMIWFRDYFISVWCYFAAVISIVVIWSLYDPHLKNGSVVSRNRRN